MKKSLQISDIHHGYIKGKATNNGWALCIGAGTSLPIFPKWKDLVINLIKKDSNLKEISSIDEIISSFSFDALIQAASRIHGTDENKFTQILSNELYEPLKSQVTAEEWLSVCNIFTAITSSRIKDPHWINYIKVRERLFKKTTAYSIAKIIIDSCKRDVAPAAILSFNAESLLYSLINSFEREPHLGKVKKAGDLKVLIDLITVSISSKCKGRIPYYFCHGALLSKLTKNKDFRLTSTSKLVFSESSYLQLANSSFSWQSINFLNICSTYTVIFIGVSLTDPNIRKWLTWIQNERNKDILEETDSTQHFWITKKTTYEDSMRWTEASVYHLGVRVIWINEWNETEIVLKNLVGL
jgi:hypothetical protein